MTFSPGVFGSSGSWSGLEGWNQPDSQVEAASGRVAEHTGTGLSSWRQGGEEWTCAPWRLCGGRTEKRAHHCEHCVGPSEQLQEPMSPPQPPSSPYVESESLLPLDSPFLSFRALAKEEDLSLRLSLGQRTIFGFL